MKKQMRFLSLIILLYAVELQNISAQCSPSMASTCSQAIVLCSLDELNGYACTNLSTIPSSCSPICSQGGTAENTSWIGFTTNGGVVSVTLSVGNCTNSQGLEFGILYNCNCNSPVACHSVPCVIPGSSQTISGTLSKCKDYYLWIDGCNGDVCDFTISTNGGSIPHLDPLGFINNVPSGIIDPVCKGCFKGFSVNGQSEDCNTKYVWTLDGNVLPKSDYEVIEIIIPTDGVHELCVSAYLHNPKDPNIICDQIGPQCASVIVRKLDDRVGKPTTICWEAANPSGYKWHSQKIYTSGTYREPLKIGNCCDFDSVVTFTVLDEHDPAIVYFIGCENTPYLDLLGRKHFSCNNKYQISLPKTTNPFKCDSSIILTSVNVDFAPSWTTECVNGMVDLIPNIKLLKPCNAGESYEFTYKWYKKNDPSNVLGSDERLLVKSQSEDYCLEVKVYTKLETEFTVCIKTFCETFNEGNLAPECSFKLHDSKVYCFDPIADYWIDEINSPKVNSYSWTVTGGNIISNPDSATVKIKWQLNPADTGKICVTYNTDCGTSCQKCIPVFLQTKIAGEDFDKRGLDAYLDAKPGPNGTWRLISGPHPVNIQDPSNPRSRFSAYNYGYYCFEWTINDLNCMMKDTLCVDLHTFPKANPEYPHLLFFERAGLNSGQSQSNTILFTPNLIENYGQSYVTINNAINSTMNYRWFDVYGRIITNDNVFIESGIQRMTIKAPVHAGMYFLDFEINGISTARKVCVIE